MVVSCQLHVPECFTPITHYERGTHSPRCGMNALEKEKYSAVLRIKPRIFGRPALNPVTTLTCPYHSSFSLRSHIIVANILLIKEFLLQSVCVFFQCSIFCLTKDCALFISFPYALLLLLLFTVVGTAVLFKPSSQYCRTAKYFIFVDIILY